MNDRAMFLFRPLTKDLCYPFRRPLDKRQVSDQMDTDSNRSDRRTPRNP